MSAGLGLPASVHMGAWEKHMGAWEKIALGWSNYEIVAAGQTRALKLGPAETTTKQAQQLVVLLPDKVIFSDAGPRGRAAAPGWT